MCAGSRACKGGLGRVSRGKADPNGDSCETYNRLSMDYIARVKETPGPPLRYGSFIRAPGSIVSRQAVSLKPPGCTMGQSGSVYTLPDELMLIV